MDARIKLVTDIISQFESCELEAYQDGGGVWTCGWGSTGKDIKAGTKWTQAEADARRDKYIAQMNKEIRALIKFPDLLNDNQYAALCSLVYNIGINAFKESTLLKKLNTISPLFAPSWESVASEFLRWNKDNGRVVAGLTNRRKVERKLFLS